MPDYFTPPPQDGVPPQPSPDLLPAGLLEKISEQDLDVVVEFTRRTSKAIAASTRKVLGARGDIEVDDIVQSVYATFFRVPKASRIDPEKTLETWGELCALLAKIAKYKTLREIQRRRLFVLPMPDEIAEVEDDDLSLDMEQETSVGDFINRLEAAEDRQNERLVAGLSDKEREVLDWMSGGADRTIGQLAGDTKGVAYERLRKMWHRLRRKLASSHGGHRAGEAPLESRAEALVTAIAQALPPWQIHVLRRRLDGEDFDAISADLEKSEAKFIHGDSLREQYPQIVNAALKAAARAHYGDNGLAS